MYNLIRLEILKYRLRPWHRAAVGCGIALIAFQYFMAAIPYLDPSEGDSALFASYDFLISLNHILGTAMFTVLGAVMGTRLIVEAYGDKKAVLLFSYPVSRKRILGGKLLIVFAYPTAAMAVWGLVSDGLFFFTEQIFPICRDQLTVQILFTAFISLICHCVIAGALGIQATWLGFIKKSVSAAIVSSVILATVICQVLSAGISFWPTAALTAVICIAGAGAAGADLGRRVQNMEV